MSDFGGPPGFGGGGAFTSGSAPPFPTSAFSGFPGSGFGGGRGSASARPTSTSISTSSTNAAALQTSTPATTLSEQARAARATTKAAAVSGVLGGLLLLMPLVYFLYRRWKKKHPDEDNNGSTGGGGGVLPTPANEHAQNPNPNPNPNTTLYRQEKAPPNVRTVSTDSGVGVMRESLRAQRTAPSAGNLMSGGRAHAQAQARAPVDPFYDVDADRPPHPYEGRIRPGMGVQRKNSYDSVMIAAMV